MCSHSVLPTKLVFSILLVILCFYSLSAQEGKHQEVNQIRELQSGVNDKKTSDETLTLNVEESK